MLVFADLPMRSYCNIKPETFVSETTKKSSKTSIPWSTVTGTCGNNEIGMGYHSGITMEAEMRHHWGTATVPTVPNTLSIS